MTLDSTLCEERKRENCDYCGSPRVSLPATESRVWDKRSCIMLDDANSIRLVYSDSHLLAKKSDVRNRGDDALRTFVTRKLDDDGGENVRVSNLLA